MVEAKVAQLPGRGSVYGILSIICCLCRSRIGEKVLRGHGRFGLVDMGHENLRMVNTSDSIFHAFWISNVSFFGSEE